MRKVWKAAFSLSALGAATVVAGGAAPAEAGELLILHRLHHKTTDTHMSSSLVDRHDAAAAYTIRAQDRPGAAADDLHVVIIPINRQLIHRCGCVRARFRTREARGLCRCGLQFPPLLLSGFVSVLPLPSLFSAPLSPFISARRDRRRHRRVLAAPAGPISGDCGRGRGQGGLLRRLRAGAVEGGREHPYGSLVVHIANALWFYYFSFFFQYLFSIFEGRKDRRKVGGRRGQATRQCKLNPWKKTRAFCATGREETTVVYMKTKLATEESQIKAKEPHRPISSLDRSRRTRQWALPKNLK